MSSLSIMYFQFSFFKSLGNWLWKSIRYHQCIGTHYSTTLFHRKIARQCYRVVRHPFPDETPSCLRQVLSEIQTSEASNTYSWIRAKYRSSTGNPHIHPVDSHPCTNQFRPDWSYQLAKVCNNNPHFRKLWRNRFQWTPYHSNHSTPFVKTEFALYWQLWAWPWPW